MSIETWISLQNQKIFLSQTTHALYALNITPNGVLLPFLEFRSNSKNVFPLRIRLVENFIIASKYWNNFDPKLIQKEKKTHLRNSFIYKSCENISIQHQRQFYTTQNTFKTEQIFKEPTQISYTPQWSVFLINRPPYKYKYDYILTSYWFKFRNKLSYSKTTICLCGYETFIKILITIHLSSLIWEKIV